MNSATIVQKLWNYCNVLRDDGMSYGDYVEQLTYLLFLKMADERSQPPWSQPSPIAQGFDWLCWLNGRAFWRVISLPPGCAAGTRVTR